jgi:hypothetical protein
MGIHIRDIIMEAMVVIITITAHMQSAIPDIGEAGIIEERMDLLIQGIMEPAVQE